jgi:hypothetical protein
MNGLHVAMGAKSALELAPIHISPLWRAEEKEGGWVGGGGVPERLMRRRKASRSMEGSSSALRMNSCDSDSPLISRMSALSSKNRSPSGSSRLSEKPAWIIDQVVCISFDWLSYEDLIDLIS